MRSELYQFDVLKDDHVIEPFFNVNWHVQAGDYGVQAVQHQGDNDGRMGSRRWDAPIKDLAKDFDNAIDLDEALRAYGATGMGIGMVAEMIDGPIWEAAIRRRLRRMGKSKHVMNVSKLHAKLLKRVGR